MSIPSGSRERIRVAIAIDTEPGVSGGIAQSTQGLVSSLGRLDGPEEFVLVARTPANAEWIESYRGPNQRVVIENPKWRRPEPPRDGTGVTGLAKRLLRPTVNKVRSVVGRLVPQNQWPSVAISNGFYESLGCDVLHFPTQGFRLCSLPTIYNPHDLQHLHYPQFFSPEELAYREVTYRTACRLSHTVVVGSEWIQQDVVRQFGVTPDKVQVIPWASPTVQYPAISDEAIRDARERLGLPPAYALYPAVTWPHKNHLRLFEALAYLRDTRGVIVPLVCTGAKYQPHWPKVQERIRELRLESQVRFLGFLSELDLRAVYRLSQFLVLPTLFEADSCPIHEAWSEGIPVASSNHTALPEQVGNAGLLFDAADVTTMADAIHRMASEADLRHRLVDLGRQRMKDFDWARTATAYRAVYRRAAGVRLCDEDRWLLEWNWMKEPMKAVGREMTQ